MKPFVPEFETDENLRSIPKDPEGLLDHVQEMHESLEAIEDPKKLVSVLGEMGVYLRTLGELDAAEGCLSEALRLIHEKNLGIRAEVQNMIRLAHVLQWRKEFDQSTEIFQQIIEICRSDEEANSYLDFALQHSGKNLFDQKKYPEAYALFEEAYDIRKSKNAPKDQIESTEMALRVTKARIQKMKD